MGHMLHITFCNSIIITIVCPVPILKDIIITKAIGQLKKILVLQINDCK